MDYDNMTYDELWPSGPKFIQAEGAFKLCTDSVLLSAFAGGGRPLKICDIGFGAGVIGIILAYMHPLSHITGVEINEGAYNIAMKNISLNGLHERSEVILGDIRDHRSFLKAGEFDLVVSNPPYFPLGSGRAAKKESMVAARDDRTCTISQLCAAASYITKWGGRFALVHRPERLSDVMCAMASSGIEPKILRFVQHKAGSAPNLFLLEGKRGGKSGLTVMPPLIMTNDDGTYTDELLRIYHRQEDK